jgi:hypothetical protein
MTSNVAFHSIYRTRAERNFKSAALHLQDAIPKKTCVRLGQISFRDFDEIDDIEKKLGDLETALEQFVETRSQLRKNEGRRKKFENVMLSWFRASYPFANLFLAVAKEGSAVRCPTQL